MLAQASEIFGFACPAIIIPQSSLRKNLRLTKKHPALFRHEPPEKRRVFSSFPISLASILGGPRLRANREYQNPELFYRKCYLNMANAGKFSSDRTIRQYYEEIWSNR